MSIVVTTLNALTMPCYKYQKKLWLNIWGRKMTDNEPTKKLLPSEFIEARKEELLKAKGMFLSKEIPNRDMLYRMAIMDYLDGKLTNNLEEKK
jgi:hypothetical protein